MSNPQKVHFHISTWEYSINVFQKLLMILKNSHLSLYSLDHDFQIFFNLWVRPLWFSTLHLFFYVRLLLKQGRLV